MRRLLVLNPTCLDVVEQHRAAIEAHGVQLLADQRYRDLDAPAALELLQDVDGVVLPSVVRNLPSAEQMRACPRLLVCSIAASGYEWLDVAAATRNGIVVTIAPGGDGAEVVADMAWGLMLAVARRIPYHHQLLCGGTVERGMGTSVYGKTLGIIGLGHIGRAVARRAQGFAMRVLASERARDEAFARQHGIELCTQEELLRQSDFVSLHVRLSDQTREMIGAAQLALMKPTAILINTARRELIAEDALVRALQEKRIAGAGLDDPPGPLSRALLGLPNVVFTPHLGNRAIEGVNSVLRTAVQNCLSVFAGQRPEFVVNPSVYEQGLARAAAGRAAPNAAFLQPDAAR